PSRGYCREQGTVVDKRLAPRFEDAPFTLVLNNGQNLYLRARNASVRGVLFPNICKDKLTETTKGVFRLGNNVYSFTPSGPLTAQARTDQPCILLWETTHLSEFKLSDQKFSFVTLQTNLLWDRYKRLEVENDSFKKFILRIYVFMLLFAAAPFSFSGFA